MKRIINNVHKNNIKIKINNIKIKIKMYKNNVHKAFCSRKYEKCNITLVISIIMTFCQATCDCYLVLEDHQLFLITFKASGIN